VDYARRCVFYFLYELALDWSESYPMDNLFVLGIDLILTMSIILKFSKRSVVSEEVMVLITITHRQPSVTLLITLSTILTILMQSALSTTGALDIMIIIHVLQITLLASPKRKLSGLC
jgi:hypothetical protein